MKLKHQTGEYYGITKEQILELYNSDLSKHRLEQIFPHQEIWEAEKPKLEVGKWYFFRKDLICITKVTKNTIYTYGFDDGEWVNDDSIHADNDFPPATDQEVQDALEKEARNRGYKNGNYECLMGTTNKVSSSKFFYTNSNAFWHGTEAGTCNQIYKNGVWAEIHEVETITKQEAEKRLNLKIID